MTEGPLGAILEVAGPRTADLLKLTEQRLSEILSSGPPEIHQSAKAVFAAGGKRLRPLLAILSAAATDESSETQHDLVSCAAAVELIHMATLVHDDVLDNADLRRGVPTVLAAHGRETATAVGDWLFAAAFNDVSGTGRAELVGILSDASTALAQGELLQREDAWNVSISRDRYFQRCTLKTGALFNAAARLGPTAVGKPQQAEMFGNFANSVGLAFQLQDDILDVVGDPAVTGKQRGTDLLDGTVTLPLIVARELDPALAELDLRLVSDVAAAERVCDQIVATGADGMVQAEAVAITDTAMASISGLLSADRARVFNLIADTVVGRSV